MTDLNDRIRIAASRIGSLNKLAVAINVPRRTLGNWLNGSRPKPEALSAIAKAANISLDWLVTGDGNPDEDGLSVSLRNSERSLKEKLKRDEVEDEEFRQGLSETLDRQAYRQQLFEPRPPAKVRYYPVYASAGHGLTALYESPGADLDIDEFCDLAFHTSAKHVMMFPIKGDSMLPTFAHGDFAAIDRRVTGEPDDGKVYLFSVDGDLYLKRAEWQEDGSLCLLSDNKAPGFVPIRVAADDLAKMKVLGQAIGLVHSL